MHVAIQGIWARSLTLPTPVHSYKTYDDKPYDGMCTFFGAGLGKVKVSSRDIESVRGKLQCQ